MIEYFIRMIARCDGCKRVIGLAEVETPRKIREQAEHWKAVWKKRGAHTAPAKPGKFGQDVVHCQKCTNPT